MKKNIYIKNTGRLALLFLVGIIISTSSLIAQNNIVSSNEYDIAYVTSNDNPSLDFFSNSTEKPTEIEAWMTSSNFWNKIEANYEKPIQIENWMTNTDLWKNKEKATLEIEDWMTDANFWKNFEVEEALSIECWMLDSNYWNTSTNEEIVQIEGWMTDSNYWVN